MQIAKHLIQMLGDQIELGGVKRTVKISCQLSR